MSAYPFFLYSPQSVPHLHTIYTVGTDFSVARLAIGSAFFKPNRNKFHGLCKCEFPAEPTLRVVSFLCASLCGRRALPGHEGLPPGVVPEPSICIMGLRATRLFARQRAVVAPRECAYPAIL